MVTPESHQTLPGQPAVAASPHVRRLRGAIVVIKYGGSFMDCPDSAVRDGVAQDLVALQAAGCLPVVVHGGGKAITRAMEDAGLAATFVQGMRVTDAATARVVEQVLSRQINPEIVAAIRRLGGRAQGFAGSKIFKCRKLRGAVDLGFVGDVSKVDAKTVRAAIRAGLIPVISPTARGADVRLYNCNADVAAARTAIALRARRLIFMSDVPGVLRDPKDPGSLLPQLRPAQAEKLKKSGVIDRGMIPKVDSAMAALRAGVEKVAFVDGRQPHAILNFAPDAPGTKITL